jgi:hypothetical protein
VLRIYHDAFAKSNNMSICSGVIANALFLRVLGVYIIEIGIMY